MELAPIIDYTVSKCNSSSTYSFYSKIFDSLSFSLKKLDFLGDFVTISTYGTCSKLLDCKVNGTCKLVAYKVNVDC